MIIRTDAATAAAPMRTMKRRVKSVKLANEERGFR
jgi:hypothetical protein